MISSPASQPEMLLLSQTKQSCLTGDMSENLDPNNLQKIHITSTNTIEQQLQPKFLTEGILRQPNPQQLVSICDQQADPDMEHFPVRYQQESEHQSELQRPPMKLSD